MARKKSRTTHRQPAADLAGARPGTLPRVPGAQLATMATVAPTGDDWLHELKFDGYRILARLENGRAELWTRNGNDWTSRFPAIAAALERLPIPSALLDGEVVAQLPDGRTSFQALQQAGEGSELLYYCFDLIHLDGADLSGVQQDVRKDAVRALLLDLPAGSPVRYSDHVVGQGPAFFRQACTAGLEGIVSKRRQGRYRGGRSGDWLKIKCLREQEFVVVGFTEPAGSRQDLGALLVATHEPEGWVYRGKVGTGFNAAALRELRRLLGPMERAAPVVINPGRGAAVRGVHWVEPEMVVQVAFTEVTGDGVLRHPTFRGRREDRPAGQVRLESAITGGLPGAASPPGPAPVSVTGKSGVRLDVEVAGVRISSPDKVLYPDRGLTKEAVARYYEQVADWIVPHIRDRPLTLVRCPQGYEGGCFFQKHMAEIDSPHVQKVRVKDGSGDRTYGSVHDLAGILTMVQLGTLELHTWNSRADKLEKPDRVTLDIDPDPTVTWDGVVQAAYEIRLLLSELDLDCLVKTTGGKGLHVVVPLQRRSEWDVVREFARALLGTVAAASPKRYTLQLAKSRRKGRLLLDYLRNARGATAVEVFSTRARAGATVSTPVGWDELEAGIDPRAFTIETVPARLASGVNPWRDYGAIKQSLTAPLLRRLGLG